MVLFALFAVAVSVAVLLLGVLGNNRAEAGIASLVLFVAPGAVGLLLSLAGLACLSVWPSVVPWLLGTSLVSLAGPWAALLMLPAVVWVIARIRA